MVTVNQLPTTIPADAQPGDRIAVCVCSEQAITRPAAYSVVQAGVVAGLNYDISYDIVTAANAGTTSTWTFAAPSSDWSREFVLLRGVVSIDGNTVNNVTAPAPFIATGVTTTSNGDLIILYYLVLGTVTMRAPVFPSGFSLIGGDATGGTVITTATFILSQNSKGPTGNFTMTFDEGPQSGAAVLFALAGPNVTFYGGGGSSD